MIRGPWNRMLVIDGPAYKVYIDGKMVGVFPDERSARTYMTCWPEQPEARRG